MNHTGSINITCNISLARAVVTQYKTKGYRPLIQDIHHTWFTITHYDNSAVVTYRWDFNITWEFGLVKFQHFSFLTSECSVEYQHSFTCSSKKQHFGHIKEIFVDASKFTQLPMFCSSKFNFHMTKPIEYGAKVSKSWGIAKTIIGQFERIEPQLGPRQCIQRTQGGCYALLCHQKRQKSNCPSSHKWLIHRNLIPCDFPIKAW